MPLNYECQAILNDIYLVPLYTSNMSIGARIRKIRQDNELSQEKFGEICGVTKGMVSQWENDIVTPPTDRLTLLREHIRFSCDWLLFGENVEYSKTDQIAIDIAHQLSVQERKAWYRIGHSLAEPDEGANSEK